MIYLPTVIDAIRAVKSRYDIKTRVDTNGLVKCMHDQPAQRLKQAGLDEIRISLNATNEQEYVALCRPRFNNAFQNLIGFIEDCIRTGIDTHVSFVVGFNHPSVDQRTEQEFVAYAKQLGIGRDRVILRHYVAPERTC